MKKNRMMSWMNSKILVRATDKYGKALQPEYDENGMKVYKKIDGEGYGIFAEKDLKKNEILIVMGGYILDINDENNLKGIVADKPIEISPEFSISPLTASDIPLMPQHYINHSCNPNSGFNGQLFIVAMKKIKAGEEIVYDYAMIMHANVKSNSLFEFACVCGSKNCRKVISENDWKSKKIQDQYFGYFQWYLQQKIEKRVK